MKRNMPDLAAVDTEAMRGHAVLTLSGVGLGAGFVLLSEMIAVRFLGSEYYGLYSIAFVLARIGGFAAGFGLRVTIVHFVPVFLYKGEPSKILGSVICSIAVSLSLGIVLATILWYFGDWVGNRVFDKPQAGRFISYAAFLIPLLALVDVLSHVPRAFNRSLEQVVTRNLVPPVAFGLFLFALGATKHSPLDAITAQFLAQIAALGVGVIFVTILLRRRVDMVRPTVPLRAFWQYSIPVLINDLLVLGITWSGLLMVGIWFPAQDVGIYRVCIQVAMVLYLFLHAVGLATGPLYAALVAKGGFEDLKLVYETAVRWLALTIVPISVIVMINASELLTLFNPEFAVGETALRVRVFGQAIGMCFGLASILLVYGGRPRLEMWNSAATLVVNVSLNFTLIPSYGIDGAAVAAASSFAVISVLRVIQARRFANVRSGMPYLLAISLISVAVALPISWIVTADILPGLPTLVLLLVRILCTIVALGLLLWLIERKVGNKIATRKMLQIRRSMMDGSSES